MGRSMKVLVLVDGIDTAVRDQFEMTWRGRFGGIALHVYDPADLIAYSAFEHDAILLAAPALDRPVTEFLRNLRGKAPRTAILAVGPDNVELLSRCLKAGADDYVRAPGNADEMVARLRACVRRHQGHAADQLFFQGFCVDLDQQRLFVNGQPVHMRPRAFQLLCCLALHAGRALSKEKLVDFMYDGRDPPEPKIIDVFICQLRSQLRKLVGHNPITTVWGRGYMLEHPDVLEPPHYLERRRADRVDDSRNRRAHDAHRKVEARR